MTSSPPLHEQYCFACWLNALGVDLRLAEAMLRAAFRVGYAEVLGNVGVPAEEAQPPAFNPARPFLMERLIREQMSSPMSEDVAAAVNGHSHG